jgi:hypothetical protein
MVKESTRRPIFNIVIVPVIVKEPFTMTGNITMLNIDLLVGSFTMTGTITMLNIGHLVGSFTMTGTITMLNIENQQEG